MQQISERVAQQVRSVCTCRACPHGGELDRVGDNDCAENDDSDDSGMTVGDCWLVEDVLIWIRCPVAAGALGSCKQ